MLGLEENVGCQHWKVDETEKHRCMRGYGGIERERERERERTKTNTKLSVMIVWSYGSLTCTLFLARFPSIGLCKAFGTFDKPCIPVHEHGCRPSTRSNHYTHVAKCVSKLEPRTPELLNLIADAWGEAMHPTQTSSLRLQTRAKVTAM